MVIFVFILKKFLFCWKALKEATKRGNDQLLFFQKMSGKKCCLKIRRATKPPGMIVRFY